MNWCDGIFSGGLTKLGVGRSRSINAGRTRFIDRLTFSDFPKLIFSILFDDVFISLFYAVCGCKVFIRLLCFCIFVFPVCIILCLRTAIFNMLQILLSGHDRIQTKFNRLVALEVHLLGSVLTVTTPTMLLALLIAYEASAVSLLAACSLACAASLDLISGVRRVDRFLTTRLYRHLGQ
jgi:hypothetical protein